MKQLDLIVMDPAGLHARQASDFVNTARRFESIISIRHGDNEANAKSMISILKLGVESEGQIRIMVAGPDEDAALRALKSLVDSGFGAEDGSPSRGDSQTELSPSNEFQPSGHVISGTPAAPGIAIGPIYQVQREQIIIQETATSPSQEMEGLERAIVAAKTQLATLHSQVKERVGEATAAILIAHQNILDDPTLLKATLANIKAGYSAGRAWQMAIEANVGQLANLKDELLAARAADVQDAGNRVLWHLADHGDQGLALPAHAVILVADDLTPSDTINLDAKRVLGICTAAGGPTSHSAIIARALGIPAIMGVGPEALESANGKQAVLDGYAGKLTVDPTPATIAAAKVLQRKQQRRRNAEIKVVLEPAITRDGQHVRVAANIARVGDAKQALTSGAEGIGLLRTEFLFLHRSDPPTEDEQFEAYRDIILALEGQPVIIRTLDVGGDKSLPYPPLPKEENPFLGQRGIRLTLVHPELLLTQIRAILRAAEAGPPVGIIFPMVTNLEEWRAVRTVVEEARADLNAPVGELGMMIEVPAAALLAEVFAQDADFFSIGTNDLTQYTLAMDRTHPVLAQQADGLHPAVLHLIDRSVRAAHTEGKRVGVCGELAADLLAIPILVGLGVDELSVNIASIPEVKAQIRSLTFSKAQLLSKQALKCATATEVRKLVARV